MSDHLHIEGMGILGSMLARRCHEEGIPFTWNDTREQFVAWPVSTGLAYPDGDPINQRGLRRWHEVLASDLIADEATTAPYLFAHKNHPHGGKQGIAHDYGVLRMSNELAVSLNPVAFVERTREAFAAQERSEAPDSATVVVCHTTPERGDGYMWGWVGRVTFDLPDEVAADLLGEQPALYAKAHRFNLTYAYPIPGTGQWWAGSVLQLQREPRVAEPDRLMKLYEEWKANAGELLGIRNIMLDELGQGWRPRGKGGVHGDFELAEKHGHRWLMPVMPTDGVRRGWLVVDDFLDRWSLL
jgi:hypothetical protein